MCLISFLVQAESSLSGLAHCLRPPLAQLALNLSLTPFSFPFSRRNTPPMINTQRDRIPHPGADKDTHTDGGTNTHTLQQLTHKPGNSERDKVMEWRAKSCAPPRQVTDRKLELTQWEENNTTKLRMSKKAATRWRCECWCVQYEYSNSVSLSVCVCEAEQNEVSAMS